MFQTTDLRKTLRAQRRTLHQKTLLHREQHIARKLVRLPAIQKAQHIAGYWPSDGEISPVLLMRLLRAQGKTIYLPCIKPGKKMLFRPWHTNTPLVKNRYCIQEPHSRLQFSPRQLHVVLTPLVAFDKKGHRLGMGAGFYDRAFAFRNASWRLTPPLIGLAHGFQKLDEIERNHWDVGLSLIQTESQLFFAKYRS